MITCTKAEANRIIDLIIRPVLAVLADSPWSLVVFPVNNIGSAPVYKDLREWREYKNTTEAKVWPHSYCWCTDIGAGYALFRQNLSYWLRDNLNIKMCILKDNSIRVRFAENLTTAEQKENAVKELMAEIRNSANYQEPNKASTELKECSISKEEIKMNDFILANLKECSISKGEKKMNDFNLTNLKSALVNKITHLDKKTITILALIALVLLVVGKYQDIKDILVGIKDKVKRSKNFKAMVADGTAAIDSLKKIVGVKDNKETTNEA